MILLEKSLAEWERGHAAPVTFERVFLLLRYFFDTNTSSISVMLLYDTGVKRVSKCVFLRCCVWTCGGGEGCV